MTAYKKDVMAATVKVKMKTERPLMTSAAVLEDRETTNDQRSSVGRSERPPAG